MARRVPLTPAYRVEVAGRALAATVGGFVLTSLLCVTVALGLWEGGLMSRAGATDLMTVSSWAIWCALAMWMFHTGRQARLWLVAAGAALLLAILDWPLLALAS